MGFDVADRPVQVGAAAEGPVDDQQIVSGWVLSAEGKSELAVGVWEPAGGRTVWRILWTWPTSGLPSTRTG
jgi:hypothetical protein